MTSAPFWPEYDPEIDTFLGEHLRTIFFSLRPDGSPTGHPMSAFYGPDGLFFNTYTKSVKVRNITRDARVACLVTASGEEAEERGVIVHGKVRFVPIDEEVRDPARDGLAQARVATPNVAGLDEADPEESERRRARVAQRVIEGKRQVFEVVPAEAIMVVAEAREDS